MAKKNHTGLLLAVGAVAALGIYSAYRRNGKPSLYIRDWLPFGKAAMTVPPWGIVVRDSEKCDVALLQGQIDNWQKFKDAGLLGYYMAWLRGEVNSGYKIPVVDNIQFSSRQDFYSDGSRTEYLLREGFVSDVDNG